MLILEPPFVSQFLVDTCKRNGFDVLDSAFTRGLGLRVVAAADAAAKCGALPDPLICTNSESALNWVLKNLKTTNLPAKVSLFKDKRKFRHLLQKIYPDFFFKEVTLAEIQTISAAELKMPFVIKPSVGFMSFGVYTVRTEADWKAVQKNIATDIERVKGLLPEEVLSFGKFIMEDFIEGEEYALDAYFNAEGEAVVLNIFHHPFLDEKDVSDRVYVTSAQIIKENLAEFTAFLNTLGAAADLKNFPLHIEIRKGPKGIIPIELNALRFAGASNADVAHFAYGLNEYEHLFANKKPAWDTLLAGKENKIFYFTIADIPTDIDRQKIKDIDMAGYLQNISKPLEVRRFDYKQNPMFAIVFGETDSYAEVRRLLALNTRRFIKI